MQLLTMTENQHYMMMMKLIKRKLAVYMKMNFMKEIMIISAIWICEFKIFTKKPGFGNKQITG